MTTQTQTAFNTIKDGINKGLSNGVYKTMEEILDIILSYNNLIETNTKLESDLGKSKEQIKMLEDQARKQESRPKLEEAVEINN